MSSDPDPTRRRLLKSIGVTSLAFGATGVASPKEVPTSELRRVESAYSDPVRARWAVAEHADPVLAELAEKGVLERASVTELDFENVETKGRYKDGTTVVHITTETEVEDATVEFVARPQTGRVYATVRPDDSDVYTVESVAGEDVVTTSDCWYEHTCDSTPCNGGNGCQMYERQCCDGGCVQNVGSRGCCTDWYTDGCCPC